jgi:hypothetical protein
MPLMKKKLLIISLLSSIFALSCQKYIQQQEQNALVQLVTSGNWAVTRYIDTGTDITTSFSGYLFHFNTNGTVTGTKSGVTANGTWSGDINTKTIFSDFPSAGDPLQKLNHTWKITDSYTDSVAANTAVGSGTNILNLKKQ